MGYDPEACILCARCVRYTQEVMQCSALSLEGRGAEARVVPTWGRSWLDTECELCGGCLSVCPTGALYEKFVEGAPAGHEARSDQDEDDVHVLRRRLPDRPQRRPGDEADRQGHVRPELRLERRQPLRQGPLRLQLRPPPGPADQPLVRGEDGELHPATWDDALAKAAAGLRGVIDRHGPQAVGVLASARLTNEENYLIQKLARGVVGTNSVHSCEAT